MPGLGGLNVWALPLAALVSFVFGAIWYMALSRPWREASDIDSSGPAASPPPATLVATYLAQLVMAWVFAQLLLNLGRGGIAVSSTSGIVIGAGLWAGLILMPLLVNNMYQGAKRALTLIDGVHWLGVMIVQGALLGGLAIR